MSVRTLCALAAAVSIPLAAHPAAARDVYRTRGTSASATFEGYDASGCVYTSVSVSASQQVTRDAPGKPVGVPGADVWGYRYDACADVWHGGFYGAGSDIAFRADSRLATARLTGRINVEGDGDFATGSLLVDVRWTGSGDLARERSTYHFSAPDARYTSRWNGMSRAAAASGTLDDGQGDLLAGLPYSYGSIWKSASHSVSTP